VLEDAEWKNWSGEAIAKACNVSNWLVSQVKASLLGAKSEPQAPETATDSEAKPASNGELAQRVNHNAPKEETFKPNKGGRPKSVVEEADERTYIDKSGKVTKMNVANIGKKRKPLAKGVEEQLKRVQESLKTITAIWEKNDDDKPTIANHFRMLLDQFEQEN
jgi:hypothetical protein